MELVIFTDIIEFCDERYLYYSGIKNYRTAKEFLKIKEQLQQALSEEEPLDMSHVTDN